MFRIIVIFKHKNVFQLKMKEGPRTNVYNQMVNYIQGSGPKHPNTLNPCECFRKCTSREYLSKKKCTSRECNHVL
jgi:hypothetical protein